MPLVCHLGGVLDYIGDVIICVSYSERLVGSDTGSNRCLHSCSKSRLSTYMPFYLPGSDSLLWPRGVSLLLRFSFPCLRFCPWCLSKFTSYVGYQISYLIFHGTRLVRIPVHGHAIIGWVAGCTYSPLFRKLSWSAVPYFPAARLGQVKHFIGPQPQLWRV